MGCTECEDSTGKLVEVEYFDGTTETVALCNECREDFTDAELVADVIHPGAEE